MTYASIVVPAYNVASTLPETLEALLAQTYEAFEIIVVDDGSTDDTHAIATRYESDPRLRIVRQTNRGLAGARNTGIDAATGDIIGFCDSDDIWVPEKLALHVRHLEENPDVGVSYSGSELIDDDGVPLGLSQTPKLRGVSPADIFKRNPIGNGSAAVIRRAVFDEIAFRPEQETERDWYFDETFRQSEDIECWLRIALSTSWGFEGVSGDLTRYRISAGGLSAATDRQLASWERMVEKLRPIAPAFFEAHEAEARAYQYRYLCRRAVSDLDADRAARLCRAWIRTSARTFLEEPRKSLVTVIAVMGLAAFGQRPMRALMARQSAKAS